MKQVDRRELMKTANGRRTARWELTTIDPIETVMAAGYFGPVCELIVVPATPIVAVAVPEVP